MPEFTGVARGFAEWAFGAKGGAAGESYAPGINADVYQYDTSGNQVGSKVEKRNVSYMDFTRPGWYKIEWKASDDCTTWVWGAAGGKANSSGQIDGSGGGGVRGNSPVSAGDTWTVIVGGQGGTQPNCGSGENGGFPDGGPAGEPTQYAGAGGGGGSSRMHSDLIPFAQRDQTGNTWDLVGGAGGGKCNHMQTGGPGGGTGGYPNGDQGRWYYPADGGTGGGAYQNQGGQAGQAGREPAGQTGAKFKGGHTGSHGGGGGGGGWYGGGGAGGYYAAGGGGSGYIAPTMTSTASFSRGPQAPNPNHMKGADDPANPGVLDTNNFTNGSSKVWNGWPGGGDCPTNAGTGSGYVRIRSNNY